MAENAHPTESLAEARKDIEALVAALKGKADLAILLPAYRKNLVAAITSTLR